MNMQMRLRLPAPGLIAKRRLSRSTWLSSTNAAGLVHGLGGIDDAIAVAKQLSGIDEDTDIELKVLGSGHSMMLPVPGSKMFADFSEWTDYIYELSRPQLWAVEPYLFEPSLLGIE